MHRLFSMKTLIACLIAFFVLAASPDLIRADDPPPLDPTMSPTGGTGSGPVVASPEAWAAAEYLILGLYPEATYEEICYWALYWFNLLPPA